jgi:hypothetical protein
MRFLLLTACACLAICGCRTVSDAWLTGWTDSSANDRIMLVREQPASLGHQRLTRQARLYPDLAAFLQLKGWPDFLAETTNDGQHYLVLYYLDRTEAWAGRTKRSTRQVMEFAGPYPITPNEKKLLRNLQQGKAAPGFKPEGC